MLGSRDIIEH
jgi:hypothetical protein